MLTDTGVEGESPTAKHLIGSINRLRKVTKYHILFSITLQVIHETVC